VDGPVGCWLSASVSLASLFLCAKKKTGRAADPTGEVREFQKFTLGVNNEHRSTT